MMSKKLVERCRISTGSKFHLKDHDPGWIATKALKVEDKVEAKAKAKLLMAKHLQDLSAAQELLYADNHYSILVILQAMDAAGKDGTIKHVMSGVNPQGCQVFSFKKPSVEELDHNFLWRYMRCLPERGRIGIFNRSYYEDVLVVKVHPELLASGRLPKGKRGNAFWKERYEDINAFERHLARNGTLILKFFLHLSKEEQKQRFLERLEHSDKNWKFSSADLVERNYWDKYQGAYEDAIRATSTAWAPWYIIPADHKWMSRTLVAAILTSGIHSLGLAYPEPSLEEHAALAAAREKLINE